MCTNEQYHAGLWSNCFVRFIKIVEKGNLMSIDHKPKLLDQVRQAARVRHMALSTEHSYVGWIRRFILYHNKRHPLEMGPLEVSDFLTHLAVEGKISASTQNQALSALLFLY